MSFRSRPSKRNVFKTKVKQIDRGVLEQECQIIKSRNVPVLRQLDGNPTRTQSFRFRRASAGTAYVTADCLMNLMVVATGSSSAIRFFGSIRLLAIKVWSSTVANTNGSNNVSVEIWPQVGTDPFDQGPGQIFETVSTGTSKPGTLHLRPGVLTKIGRAMASSSQTAYNLFTTSGNPGDVIEVTLEYDLFNISDTASHSLVATSATAGAVYQNTYLDNTSTSGTAGTQILANLSDFPLTAARG